MPPRCAYSVLLLARPRRLNHQLFVVLVALEVLLLCLRSLYFCMVRGWPNQKQPVGLEAQDGGCQQSQRGWHAVFALSVAMLPQPLRPSSTTACDMCSLHRSAHTAPTLLA